MQYITDDTIDISLVSKLAKQIEEAKKTTKNLNTLFFSLLDQLSKEQNLIAQKQEIEKWNQYGQKRELFIAGHITTTTLKDEKSLSKILPCFYKYLKTKENICKKEAVILSRYADVESELQFKYIDPETYKTANYHQGPSFFLDESPTDLDYLRNLKKNNVHLFESRKIAFGIAKIHKKFEEPKDKKISTHDVLKYFREDKATELLNNQKNAYIVATLFMTVNFKKIELAKYFTWLFINSEEQEESPLKRMIKCSKVVVLHQDQIDISNTLNEVAILFNEAVMWDEKKERELMCTVAKITYLLSHCQFNLRGSKKIIDLLTTAIYYTFENTELKISKNFNVEEQAFTFPIYSDFLNEYEKNVTFRKLNDE